MERISPRFLNTFPPDKMLCHPYWMAEPPFRIWGNLYFVGNSWCSCHLIGTGDGLILLDTPCLAELPYLLDSIWSVGFNPREIRMILISHAHHDHYGAASALRHITGAKICLSAVDAADMAARPEWFHRHNRERIPPDENFRADRLLEDGETVKLGDTQIQCALTPGHTPGTMSHFWTAHDRERGPARIGIYGGAGFGTVRTAFLEEAGLPLSLQQAFEASIQKVWYRPVDLMLGNHPCHNDTFSKWRRLQAGEQNPFWDPSEWQRFLGELRCSYRAFMALAPADQTALYERSRFCDYCGDRAARWFQRQGS